MPPRRSAPREAGQDWDGDHEEQSRSYEKQRVRWKGLTGGNERRVKQRQQSFAQTQAANDYMRQRRQREEDEASEAERQEKKEQQQRQREWWDYWAAIRKVEEAARKEEEAQMREAAGGCICAVCDGGCVASGCYECECGGECTGVNAEVPLHWRRERDCVMCKVW